MDIDPVKLEIRIDHAARSVVIVPPLPLIEMTWAQLEWVTTVSLALRREWEPKGYSVEYGAPSQTTD